ncbi:hypothetical protein SLNWT_2511 [Streptomyces albus]|uniref:Uncharacterized protein n=1 Tax=Streptomyces albus (strain ATCC 21838 / DSM 41398 / FERM P-419 / JCM 4703 / NBRC 107858) TaxID=1081613 RepID=A0A0B5EXR7_STRA4|nr:hypothetical protein SLNWT_2511 [Streptomyces albus]AOU77198.1 hypothetical protein SLNHY_2507 [Streptomyces albus]AYN32976.1 hypothetical protein DUI70_2474 [Streptomyces albus]
MNTALESRTAPTGARDPHELLDAVQPHVKHLTRNVFDSGMTLWDREIALLLRDHEMVRDMAERILSNALMYMITSIERPEWHLGVGKLVDKGVHQIYLDTPVLFAFFATYNGGEFKHHAPFLQRRRDGIVLRTADLLRANGFAPDEELWSMDGADCSPCDDKVPDSH